MTPVEALRKEQEEIIQRTGDYIPPYELASMTRTAQKVVELLTTKADTPLSYRKCQIILGMVSGAIKGVTE